MTNPATPGSPSISTSAHTEPFNASVVAPSKPALHAATRSFRLPERIAGFLFGLLVLLSSCQESGSWVKVSTEVPRHNGWQLSYDSKQIQTIVPGQHAAIWGSTVVGSTCISVNQGKTWTIIGLGNGQPLTSLTVNVDAKQFWAVRAGQVVCSTDSGKQWQAAHIVTGRNLHFTRLYGCHNNLWAVGISGDSSFILHNTIGDKKWLLQHRAQNEDIEAIWSDAAGRQLWAIGSGRLVSNGDSSFILHSLDGGGTWQTQHHAKGEYLRAIWADTAGQQAWVVGYNKRDSSFIRHSENGGKWITQHQAKDEYLRAIWGDDSGRQLWAIGNSSDGSVLILHSENGGKWITQHQMKNWNPQAIWSDKRGQQLWAIGGNDISAGSDSSIMLHSTDGGKQWETQRQAFEYLQIVWGSKSGRQLWAVGRNGNEISAVGNENSLILHSMNGGGEWRMQHKGPETLQAIWGDASGQQLWAVGRSGDGDNGIILHGNNGSGAWQTQYKAQGRNLHAIWGTAFGQQLWAVGDSQIGSSSDSSLILHSGDGGGKWQTQRAVRNGNLQSVWGSAAGQQVWAVGTSGDSSVILHSIDWGKKWETQHKAEGEALQAIWGDASDQQLWAVGDSNYGRNSLILHSVNGGKDWESQRTARGEFLQTIQGDSSGQQLWATGNNNLLLYSADKGQHWQAQKETGDGSQMNLDVLNGLYASYDGKKMFIPINSGILANRPDFYYPHVDAIKSIDHGKEIELRVKLHPFDKANPYKRDNISLQAKIGLNANEYSLTHPVEDSQARIVSFKRLGSDSLLWVGTFSADDFNIYADKKYYVSLTLKQGDFQQSYPLTNSFTHLPWTFDKFVKDNPWLIPLGIVLLVYGVLFGLLLVYPFGLYLLYKKIPLSEIAEKLSGPTGKVIVFLLNIPLPLSFFVQHERVLDAWIDRHFTKLKAGFEREDTVRDREGYVPLPVRVGDAVNGQLIETPTLESFAPFFQAKRTVLSIIGAGGSGKTSLAIKLGRWAMEPQNRQLLSQHVWMPVLIEEDVLDLIPVLKSYFKPLVNEQVDTAFIEALLEKQRLLIIVDALSERTAKTQEYIQHIHGTLPVNALIVSSRLAPGIDVSEEVRLYPQALNSEKLLQFMTTLLAGQPDNVFRDIENQLELGHQLAKLFRYNGQPLPIIPILVKLAIEQALELAGNYVHDVNNPEANLADILKSLPTTIPEIYFAFLRRVNPQGRETSNRISQDEMLRIAAILGELCLGKNLTPKDFAMGAARTTVPAPAGANPDPIQRLIDNGILLERYRGAAQLLRFSLDPVAEYLAAFSLATKCGQDPAEWKKVEQRIVELGEKALGFKLAFELVREVYRDDENGWPAKEEN